MITTLENWHASRKFINTRYMEMIYTGNKISEHLLKKINNGTTQHYVLLTMLKKQEGFKLNFFLVENHCGGC